MSYEFLKEIGDRGLEDALERSLRAYHILRREFYEENAAALLIIAAQIDWMAATIAKNMPGEEE